MKIQALAGAALAPFLGIGAALAQNPVSPENIAVNVSGVETVCTGSDYDARRDTKWRAYTTRFEFAGKAGQYLGEEQVHVSGPGVDMTVRCQGPWVLMKLPKGAYQVGVDVADAGHKDLKVRAPSRVAVSFPNAGGVFRRPQPLSSRAERTATANLNRKILATPNPLVHNPQIKDHYTALAAQYQTEKTTVEQLQQKYRDQLNAFTSLNSQIQDWSEQKRQQYQNQQQTYSVLKTTYEEQSRLNEQQRKDYQTRLSSYETELRTSR